MKKEFLCFWCCIIDEEAIKGDEFYHHRRIDLCKNHFLKCKPSVQKLFLKIKTNMTTLHRDVWCDGPVCKTYDAVADVFRGILLDAKSGKKMSEEFEDIIEFIFEDQNINDMKNVDVDDEQTHDVMGELLHEQFYPMEMYMEGIVGTRYQDGEKDYCENCIKIVDVKNPTIIKDGSMIYHSSFDVVKDDG